MFGKTILPLFGAVAFIWAVVSPSEGTSMSPREAIERAIPQLQVEIEPTAFVSASMRAQSIALELKEGRLLYQDEGRVIVTRRRVRRTEGSYRPLPLPQDVKQAVMALGTAWAEAAESLPQDRTLFDVVFSGDPTVTAPLDPIKQAYANLRSVAAGYEVTLPETWAFVGQDKLARAERRLARKAGR